MTRPLLVPCPTCARHIRVASGGACPFCAAPVPAALASRLAPRGGRPRSRAGMYAHTAGASLLALAAASCGGLASGTDGGGGEDGPRADAASTDLVSTHYGGPPPIDAATDAGGDAGSDVALPPFDAALIDASDAACEPDACPTHQCCGAGCCPVPPYGAPFPPDDDAN